MARGNSLLFTDRRSKFDSRDLIRGQSVERRSRCEYHGQCIEATYREVAVSSSSTIGFLCAIRFATADYKAWPGTRGGNDWTNRFRKIAGYAWHINAGSAIIDGEVVVTAADGTTDFSVLQNEL